MLLKEIDALKGNWCFQGKIALDVQVSSRLRCTISKRDFLLSELFYYTIYVKNSDFDNANLYLGVYLRKRNNS